MLLLHEWIYPPGPRILDGKVLLPAIRLSPATLFTGVLYTAGGGSVMRIKAAGGTFNIEHELLTKVRGHSLAYDAGRKLVFIPGGEEGHSKLLVVRSIDGVPATPSAAPRAESLLR